MMRWIVLALLLLLESACARNPRLEPIPGPDPLARATPATPAQVIPAAAAVLQQLGLPVAPVIEGTTVVMTYPVLLQTWWPPVPVSERLLCGVPFPRLGEDIGWRSNRGYGLESAVELTQGIPIRVRMGFNVADRLGGSTTRLIVEAVAERPSLTPILPAEIACIPTRGFVDDVFRTLAAALESPAGS